MQRRVRHFPRGDSVRVLATDPTLSRLHDNVSLGVRPSGFVWCWQRLGIGLEVEVWRKSIGYAFEAQVTPRQEEA